MAKCPACRTDIATLTMTELSAKGGGAARRCIGYVCPECDAVIAVEMDPIERRDRIIDEVVRSLKHR